MQAIESNSQVVNKIEHYAEDEQEQEYEDGPDQVEQLEAELRDVDQYRLECIQGRKFAEAQKAQDRVEVLKVEIYQVKRLNLLQEQEREKDQIEVEQIQHLQTFEEEWQEHEQTLVQESQSQLQQLDEKHAKEMEDLRADLEEKLPKQFKPSSKLLNTRKIQDSMINQKKYQEAQELEDESLEMEEQQRVMHEEQRQKKIVKAEETLVVKQATERAALEKKLRNIHDERASQKGVEYNRIVKKFTNMLRDLENKQQISTIRLANLYNQKPELKKGAAQSSSTDLGESRMTPRRTQRVKH